MAPTAGSLALALLCGAAPLLAQTPVPNALAGRCAQDLPLDAGQGFSRQRFLVLSDRTYLFEPDPDGLSLRWHLASRTRDLLPGTAAGPFRLRKKWRDGALWMKSGSKLYRRDPALGQWVLKAEPDLEFMDFEVDMTGRIFLVATGDPHTHSYRALLEVLDADGRRTEVVAPYPDPGALAWMRTLNPVAAAALQAGFESVQILEFTLLFNPLSRRLFLFRPLEDRLQEVKLGVPLRTFKDLEGGGPLDDLCWQVLPKDAAEAWVVMGHAGPGLRAIPVDLREGTAGEPVELKTLHLPVFPGPDGRLQGLEDALRAFERPRPRPATAPGP